MLNLNSFKTAMLILMLLSALAGAADLPEGATTAPARANCELRILEPSQAGSIFLSTFAPDKEACMKLEDGKTKAVFRSGSNHLRRSSIGPKDE